MDFRGSVVVIDCSDDRVYMLHGPPDIASLTYAPGSQTPVRQLIGLRHGKEVKR
jgi:hypothetical protein